ncbi:MAG: hypothetical protein WBP81_05520, partial [Solirubrobacteraceae bacterium]
LDQFIPWVRLDGYHIVSDLIGVSDLFARIKPVIGSLVPGRHPDPRVTELKPWARAAVTIWVLTTLAALASIAVVVVVNAPSYLRRAWQSLILQFDGVGHGARIGSVVDVLNGAIGTVMLLLPVAGITLTYVLLCRGTGTSLALRRDRVELTPSHGRCRVCQETRAHYRPRPDTSVRKPPDQARPDPPTNPSAWNGEPIRERR